MNLNPNNASYPGSPTRLHHSYASTSSTPTLDLTLDRLVADTATTSTIPPLPPLWPHRLSASFSAMADQIAAASQALALVPATAFSGSDLSGELGVLRTRLEGIEQTQERIMGKLEALKVQMETRPRSGMNGKANADLQVDSGETTPTTMAATMVDKEEHEVDKEEADVVALQAAKIEALEKKLNELSETVRLDQERLPARLHNSRATVMKASLKTPIAANGKPVSGFPLTRGEFEHITKERYEALLKAYGHPLKGDTAAKRDALRAFAGIPQDGQ